MVQSQIFIKPSICSTAADALFMSETAIYRTLSRNVQIIGLLHECKRSLVSTAVSLSGACSESKNNIITLFMQPSECAICLFLYVYWRMMESFRVSFNPCMIY